MIYISGLPDRLDTKAIRLSDAGIGEGDGVIDGVAVAVGVKDEVAVAGGASEDVTVAVDLEYKLPRGLGVFVMLPPE